jgi:hypothetical protein
MYVIYVYTIDSGICSQPVESVSECTSLFIYLLGCTLSLLRVSLSSTSTTAPSMTTQALAIPTVPVSTLAIAAPIQALTIEAIVTTLPQQQLATSTSAALPIDPLSVKTANRNPKTPAVNCSFV